jgi:hypothetical protein
MFLFPITKTGVEKVVRNLKSKLSAGSDEIPDYVVKQCIGLLKIPLTKIYNASLELGIFPHKLKKAKVVPVHKKGDAREIMHNRLAAFIEENGVLTEAQRGFGTRKSMETALQVFIKSVQ